MKKIILITGGQRSGKSTKAEELALSLSDNPVYLATAHIWDEEFRERVRKHQERRGPQWTNIEEEINISNHDVTGRVVVIDCITLWLTNIISIEHGTMNIEDGTWNIEHYLEKAKKEFDAFTKYDATYIFVTNEIGLGGVSTNQLQRKFTDLQGWMNQYVAQAADEVILMVSGIPVMVKETRSSRSSRQMIQFNIKSTEKSLQTAILHKIDNLNKPKGSLGRLEELAMQICLIQQTLEPSLAHPCHLLLGGDHGIEREGVSVSPREVTWQQMINFTHGGGGVNMFCRQHGFKLRIVDVGVDYDLSNIDGIIHRKISRGTKNFLYEPAMSEAEFDQAIQIGCDLVDDCIAEGCRILSIGEMGIANTSPSSIWMHLFTGIPLEDCIGAGAGLDAPGIRHKYEVLSNALANYQATTHHPTPITHIRHFGGYEMIAAIGAMLKAAEKHLVILIDGFIMTACALAAIQLYPGAKDYMIFTHCGDESGHKRMLDAMGANALLNLGLRLGEGTGALCAFPIIDSAVRMMNEMNNFDNARITKYF